MPQLMHKISPEFAKNKGIQDFVDIAIQNMNDVFDAILQHRVFTKRKVDVRRRADPDIKEGDKVYLSTKDLALPKGQAAKLLPKYIGPYLILEATLEVSTYRLDLPEMLQSDIYTIAFMYPNCDRI